MSKRKELALGNEAANDKHKKSGFTLRLIQAILFTVALIVVIIYAGIVYHDNHCDTFIQWLKAKQNNEYIENDGTLELTGDKHYDNWEGISIHYYIYETELSATVIYIDNTVEADNVDDKYRWDHYYFLSENTTAKTATFANDNGETITISYINFENYRSFTAKGGWLWDFDLFIILSIIAAACAVFAALQFIGAFVGKKHKWANILCIVIGAITIPCYLLGIFGLIGGVMGKKYLNPATPEQTQDTHENETTTVSAPKEPTEEYAPAPATMTEPSPTEYIKPKLSPKAQKAMMITMIASHALLLIVGILFVTVEALSPTIADIGICKEVSARAYGIVIGMMMLVGVPSIGYYFASIAPIKLSKKSKIILAAVTTVIMLALIATAYIVIYFVKVDGLTINSYFEDSDTWFVPMSVAFAPLGLMICYLLMLFRINPQKIRATKPERSDGGLIAVIKYMFTMIVYGIMLLVKGILSFKEKQPEIFILIATVLLTWLAFFTAFVLAIICIVILVGVIVMYFTGVMSLAYIPETGKTNNEPSPADEYYRKDEYTYVDNYGYTQTIYTDHNGKEARDAGGHYVGEISDGNDSEKKFTPAGVGPNSEQDAE